MEHINDFAQHLYDVAHLDLNICETPTPQKPVRKAGIDQRCEWDHLGNRNNMVASS